MPARTIVIAGGGIGGLTAALALAAKGFRVEVFEAAQRLEEVGAGVQLSPNASRILIALGLADRLAPAVVEPVDLRIKTRRDRELARLPLGSAIAARHGAPYWSIHRGDLQTALVAAVREHPAITLELGARIETYAVHARGVTVQASVAAGWRETYGMALIAADGLWSSLRGQIVSAKPPSFARRAAYRATVPVEAVAPDYRLPAVHLWLGRDAHLVHYPVKAGTEINIVAIGSDAFESAGYSHAAGAADLARHFPATDWAASALGLLATPREWVKWPLYDLPPLRAWGDGPVSLLGDAAHPMLPFLAQGAAMAIEDSAVLAHCLAAEPDAPASALRRYESLRRSRTAQVQRAARRNSDVYHLGWPESAARDLALRALGGQRLLARYDWVYGWRPD